MTVEESRDKRIVYMASVIGVLVALLITIIAANRLFPPLMFYSIVVLLIVLIIIINGYGIFGQQLINTIKKKAIARQHSVLTQQYFKKFKKFVERFRERMREDHCDAMPHILRNIANDNPKYANILPSTQSFTNAIDACYAAMGKLPVTKDSFLLLVEWFESILNLCNEHLIYRPLEEIRRAGQDEIRENTIEEYKRCKTLYDRFLDDYMDFAKDMNSQFGENIARTYYQVPRGLSK